MENKEKFKELLQDEDFVAKLLEMQTPEEVQKAFKTSGVEIKLDEVNEILRELNLIIGLASDEDLNNIVGGKLSAAEKKDKFLGKFYEKLGDAAGNLVWTIPTVAISTVVSVFIGFHLNRSLKAQYPDPKDK